MKFHHPLGSRRTRIVGAFAAGTALITGAALVTVVAPANAAAGCQVDYAVDGWGNGFVVNVTASNLGDPLTSWTLEWDFAGNQRITNAWNGVVSQSGGHVTLRNATWNGGLPTNGKVQPGFQGTYSGSNAKPTSFTLNGVVCNGQTARRPRRRRPARRPPAHRRPARRRPALRPPALRRPGLPVSGWTTPTSAARAT